MNGDDARQFVRLVLDKFYDGGYAVLDGLCWGFAKDGLPTVLSVFDENEDSPPELRITAGVAVDIPGSPGVYEKVCEINEGLYFGRACTFSQANGAGMSIFLQEIVPLYLISFDYQPSIDFVLSVIASLHHAAVTQSPQVLQDCGGQPWANPVVLAMSG